jgi:hypothetical protein
MANISAAMQKSMLDWSLGVVTAPTRPVGCFVGLSLGAPTSVSSSEVATGSGYARSSATMAPAVTAGGTGSATNSNAMTFGPFSSSAVVSGIFLAESVSSGAGTMLWFGNLATVRTPLIGDSLVLGAGALTVTLV